jgi:AcrR family transcriptional regulator
LTSKQKPQKRRPQAQRSAASTEAMLSAAMNLVLEHGSKVSMMAIGQRSGFSHGLVLARFGSKGALIEAMAKEAQRRFAEGVNALSIKASGIAKLDLIIDAYFQPPSTEAKAFYILLGESLGPDPHLHAAFAQTDDAFRRYIRKTLQEARENGEIDESIDVSAAAFLLVSMFRGAAIQYLVNPAALEMDAIRVHAHEFVARYLRPGSQSPAAPLTSSDGQQ